MSKSETTLLIHAGDVWLRADVSRAGDVVAFAHARHTGGFADGLGALLQAGDKPCRKTWLLTDRAWLGDVELPATAVIGLDDTQLADAAAYEAESLCGLSPDQSLTAVRKVHDADGQERHLTLQLARTDMQSLAAIIRKQGGRLQGVMHPAGLPESLADDQPSAGTPDWLRVEFWQEQIVVVQAQAGQVVVHPTGIAPTSAWRRSIAPLLQTTGMPAEPQKLIAPQVRPQGGATVLTPAAGSPSARWADDTTATPTQADASCIHLENEDDGREFARRWAMALTTGRHATPMLVPQKASTGRWLQVAVGCIALLLAVVTVIGLRQQQAGQLAELRASAAHVQQEQKELVSLRNTARTLSQQKKAKQRDVDRRQAERLKLDRQSAPQGATAMDLRPHLASLMDMLSQASSQDLVVQSITPDRQRHHIHGVARSPQAVLALAHRLEALSDGRWRAQPPQLSAMAQGSAILWQFSIGLDPAPRGSRSAGASVAAVEEVR